MPEMSTSMKDKVCMVTGATSGIGLVTARELARMGAMLVIVSRSPERCAATVAAIRQETGSDHLDFIAADLSSQAQIRHLVDTFHERYNRLHVLVNNAGAFFLRRKESEDGIEMTFALNHLGYFLLTNLLLDTLLASASARVINVSSGAHKSAQIDFDDLGGRRRYSGWRAYAQSKLANVLFTYELARRLDGTHVTANVLHPGWVATNLGRNNTFLARLVMPLIQRGALTPEEGARTGVYLASSPEVAGVSGKYFFEGKAIASNPISYNQDVARRLWEVSTSMVSLS